MLVQWCIVGAAEFVPTYLVSISVLHAEVVGRGDHPLSWKVSKLLRPKSDSKRAKPGSVQYDWVARRTVGVGPKKDKSRQTSLACAELVRAREAGIHRSAPSKQTAPIGEALGKTVLLKSQISRKSCRLA